MTTKLINFFLQFGNLNAQQIDLIKSKAAQAKLRKDEYFAEAGKVPNRIGFIVEGIIRVCHSNDKGEDVTRYFFNENHRIADMSCFDNETPSSECIQAVTDCTLLVVSRQDWNQLSGTIAGWDGIIAKIIQRALLQKLAKKQ